MNGHLSSLAAISLIAWLPMNAADSFGCGLGSASITNLPPLSNGDYQVNGLNPGGQLTGFFFVIGEHPSQGFFYTGGQLLDIGTLGGSSSEGHSINQSGNIVGSAALPGDTNSHAFFYSDGLLQDLGTLGGPSSSASAINDTGVIIGSSDLATAPATSAFIYINKIMSNLGNLGSNYSSAFALNNAGVVVGEAGVPIGDVHAFSWSNGVMSDLGTFGGTYSSAFAVNDAGMVVGEAAVDAANIHAFVYGGNGLIDLGTFGGTYSSAYLVNSNSQVIGVANTTDDLETHGFFYDKGTITDLGSLGGGNTLPNGLNNQGQVVGQTLMGSGDARAFLWQNGQLVDLNLLLPANSGWLLVTALYINDAGRVIGLGEYNGTSQWFVMDLASANHSPIAFAGPDQTVDCQSTVTLDGSKSSDPDNDTLSFEWSASGNVLGTSAVLGVALPLGTNVVTLKVTDPCGASSQTNVSVIVVDHTPPTGSCPSGETVSADSHCQAALPDFTSQVVATDNCTPVESIGITQAPAAGTLLGIGQHPVSVTVTDSSGNSSTCTVLFTVVDTTPPTIVSVPPTFTLSVGASCQAQVPNILGNVVATDSCTPANQLVKSQSPAAGAAIGIGDQSILVTVTDGAGNSSTAKVGFKVADTTAPTILSAPSSAKLSAGAQCQAAVPNFLSSVLATDNCTPANLISLVQTPAAGTLLPEGLYRVQITATDAAGNSSTTNVSLEIDDTTPPTFLIGPSPVKLCANGNCQAHVPNLLTSVVVSDNCTPAKQLVLVQTPAAGTVLAHGSYTVLITCSDAAGNASTLSVPLEIDDTTAPTFQSLTVSPSVLSPPDHQLANVVVSASVKDNCDPAPVTKIISITCDQPTSSGDIQITGGLTARLAAYKGQSGYARVYTIVVQSTDASGNASTGSVTVTVSGKTAGGGAKTPKVLQQVTKILEPAQKRQH